MPRDRTDGWAGGRGLQPAGRRLPRDHHGAGPARSRNPCRRRRPRELRNLDVRLRPGPFAFTQENKDACTWGYGTFAVKGNQVEWTFTDGGGIAPNNAFNKPGEFFVFGWSLYRETLTLTAVPGASPENFRAMTWQRISTTPSSRPFSKRCPPPANALPR